VRTPAHAKPAVVTAAPERAVSLSDYIQAADAICDVAQREVGSRGRAVLDVVRAYERHRVDRAGYFRRTGALTAASGGIVARAAGRLRSLDRPLARTAALDAYLHGVDTQAQLLVALGAAQARGDRPAIAALNQQHAVAATKTHAAAREFGFKTCGA
jgi:hypothetical protein